MATRKRQTSGVEIIQDAVEKALEPYIREMCQTVVQNLVDHSSARLKMIEIIYDGISYVKVVEMIDERMARALKKRKTLPQRKELH